MPQVPLSNVSPADTTIAPTTATESVTSALFPSSFVMVQDVTSRSNEYSSDKILNVTTYISPCFLYPSDEKIEILGTPIAGFVSQPVVASECRSDPSFMLTHSSPAVLKLISIALKDPVVRFIEATSRLPSKLIFLISSTGAFIANAETVKAAVKPKIIEIERITAKIRLNIVFKIKTLSASCLINISLKALKEHL